MDEFRRKIIDSNDIYAQDNNIVIDNSEVEDDKGIKTKGFKLNDNLDFNDVHIKGTLEVDGKSTFNDNVTFNKDVKTENNAHFIDNNHIVISEIEESIESVEPERETKSGYNLYGVVDVDKEDTKLKFYYSKFAPLNNNNIIPSEFLPSYVDDVIEVSDFYKANGTKIDKDDDTTSKELFSGVGDDGTTYTKSKGESGRIYIYDKANGSISGNQISIYRWSGSQFIEIADFDALEKWCKENLVSTSVIENSNGTISFILKNTNGTNRGSIIFKATNGTNLLYDTNKNQITINTEYNGDNWVKVDNTKKEITHKEHSETAETIESSNTNSGLGPNSTINIPSISFDSKGHKSGNSSKTLKLIGKATTSSDGFMSKEDKSKLGQIVDGANYYDAKLILSNSSVGTTLVKSDSNAYINFVESYQNSNDVSKTVDKIDTSIALKGGKNIKIVGSLDGTNGIITFDGYDTTIKSGTNSIPTTETINVISTINSNNNGFDREYTYNTVTIPSGVGIGKLIDNIDYVNDISVSGNKISYSKKVSVDPVDVITFKGENGISASITDETLTIKHSNSPITADNNAISFTSLSPDSTSIVFPYISYDTNGHITGKGNKIVTLSDFAKESSLIDYAKKTELDNYVEKDSMGDYAKKIELEDYVKKDSMTNYAKKTDLDELNYYNSNLVISGSSTGTSNKTSSSSATYLNFIEIDKSGNKSVKKSVGISAQGRASVTSDGSKIIFSSSGDDDTNTLYSLTVGDGSSISNTKVVSNPKLQLIADKKEISTAIPVNSGSWISTYSNGNSDITIAHKKVNDMQETIAPSFVKVGIDEYGHVASSGSVTSSDIKPLVDSILPTYSIIENPTHTGYYYLTDGTSQLGEEFKVDDKNLFIKANNINALSYNGDNESSLNIIGEGDIVVSTSKQGVISIKGTDTKYSLPIASSTRLGGVKIGSNITIGTDGTISVEKPIFYKGIESDYGTILIEDNNVSISNAIGKKGTSNSGEIFNNYAKNIASGNYSHAEGTNTQALAVGSHSEGTLTIVSSTAEDGHAEGQGTKVTDLFGHAEGSHTEANGITSHAEGEYCIANGDNSHAQNYYTIASGLYQTSIGKYNVEDTNDTYSLIIGNGKSNTTRHNMITSDWNGVVTAYGKESDFVLDNEDGTKISLRNIVNSQDKANVSYTPVVTSGTELGKITINNVTSSIYMPSTSGVVTSAIYNDSVTATKKTIIGNLTVNGTTKYNISIPTISSSSTYGETNSITIGTTNYGDVTTKYNVPYATNTSYGVVKAGTNISISSGAINAVDSKYKLSLSGKQLSIVNSNDSTTVNTVELPNTDISNLIISDGNNNILYDGSIDKTITLRNNLSITNNSIDAKDTTYSLSKNGNTYSLVDSDGVTKGNLVLPSTLVNPNALKITKGNVEMNYTGVSEKSIKISDNLNLTYDLTSNAYNLSATNTTYNMRATSNGYGLYNNSNVLVGEEIIIPDVGITSINSTQTSFGTINVSTSGHTSTLSISGSPISIQDEAIKLSKNLNGSNPIASFSDSNLTLIQSGAGNSYSYDIGMYSIYDLLRLTYDIVHDLYEKAGFNMQGIPDKYFSNVTTNQILRNLQDAVNGSLTRTTLL